MSTIPEGFAHYLSVEETIVNPMATLSVMYFAYGIYILLFGAYVYITGKRQQGNEVNGKLYLSLTAVLFGLSTIYVAVYTRLLVVSSIVRFNGARTRDYGPLMDFLMHDAEKTGLCFLGTFVPVFLNITADCMLIHRCYLIWGFKKRIAWPLIVASVLTNALGIIVSILMTIGSIDTRIEFNDKLAMIGINLGFVYNISSAVVNSVITLLTAGRIWWIHRQVRAHGIHTSDGPVSRIILESGMIFPMLSIAALCTANTAASVVVDLSPITYSSAGFAPTLIMVRAKLGKNVESLQDHVSDIRFTSQPIPRDETRHSIRSLGVAVVEVEGVREQPEQMADGNLKEGNVV